KAKHDPVGSAELKQLNEALSDTSAGRQAKQEWQARAGDQIAKALTLLKANEAALLECQRALRDVARDPNGPQKKQADALLAVVNEALTFLKDQLPTIGEQSLNALDPLNGAIAAQRDLTEEQRTACQ